MARPESCVRDNRNKVCRLDMEVLPFFSKHPNRRDRSSRCAHDIHKPKKLQQKGKGDVCETEKIEQNLVQKWKEETHREFPKLLSRFHIIPPISFNRVCYEETQIGNDVIKMPQPNSQTSDARASEARQRVVTGLTLMMDGKSEVMVVLFSLAFDNYLNAGGKAHASTKKKKQHNGLVHGHGSGGEQKPPWQSSQRTYNSQYRTMRNSYVPYIHFMEESRASTSLLDVDLSIFHRPRDLPGHLQRGEVDVLIIHRDYGLLAVEVKALGNRFPSWEDDPSAQRNIIRQKIGKSLQQLKKHVEVLRYILPEAVQAGVAITTVLMLPNLTRLTVHEAVTEDPDLIQAFCQCFETSTLDKAFQKCVFSDQLPPIGQAVSADDDIIKALYRDWWLPLTRGITSHSMTNSLYESIIARFCGPATKQYVFTANNPRAEVSTLSQAVLETSRCFTGQVLTEEQVAMLSCQSPRVWLSGPPGTGAALMLQLKAREWLRQGHSVMMVSLWPASHAVIVFLHHKVTQNLTAEQMSKLFYVLSSDPCFDDVLAKLLEFRQQKQMKDASADNLLYRDSGFADYDMTDLYDGNDEKDSLEDESTDSSDEDAGFMKRHPRKVMKKHSKICQICAYSDYVKKHFSTKKHREPYQYPHVSSSQTSDHRNPSGSKESIDQSQKLHVIVDEAPCFLDSFMLVLETVLGKDGFVIWVATSLPCTQPSGFTCFELTKNLRCPPSVVREMMETPAYKLFRRVMYTSEDTGVLSGTPLPTDGPMVKRIQHRGHEVKDVWNCVQCGKDLAAFLTVDLKIGNTAAGTFALSAASDSTLHYSDVLISGHLPTLGDLNRSRWEGQTHDMDFIQQPFHQFPFPAVEHPLPGFLKGLDQSGVPFELLVKDVRSYHGSGSYHRLADPQSIDFVQVAEPDMLKGLERAVVVVLGTVDLAETLPRYVDPLYDVMGCCTSQLIIVGDAESSLAERLQEMRRTFTSPCI